MAITYHTEDCTYNLKRRRDISSWIKASASEEGFRTGDIAVVLCSDDHILKVNNEYLGHDYYTDIITFDYSEGRTISGDLIISVDTVRSNALAFGTDFTDELHRVIIHGIMHLCGYKDKSDSDAKTMRSKEDHYLSRFASMPSTNTKKKE